MSGRTRNRRTKKNNKNKKNRKPRNQTGTINTTLRRVLGPQVAGNYTTGFTWVKLGMKYSDTFDTTLTAGTVSTQVMRANSIFDPDRTNTGHQPLEYDQYMPIYNRYHIYAMTWHLTFSSAADAYHITCGIVNGAEAFTSVTDFRTFREGPMSRDYTSSYGSPAVIARGRQDLWKYNGMGMTAYMTDDRFGAIMTTNPVEIIDFIIMLYNPTANSVLIHWQLDIKYHCVVHDPILADPSTIRERYELLDSIRSKKIKFKTK